MGKSEVTWYLLTRSEGPKTKGRGPGISRKSWDTDPNTPPGPGLTAHKPHSPRRRTLVQAGLDKGLDQNFVVVVDGRETVTVVKTPRLKAAQP